MASTDFRLFTDFTSAPGNEPDYDALQFQIVNSIPAISKALISIPTPANMNPPAKVGFAFSGGPLTGADDTQLSVIVAAHDGAQLDGGANVTAFSRLVDPTGSENTVAGFDDGDFFINKANISNPSIWQKQSEIFGIALWKRVELTAATNRIEGLLAQTNQPGNRSEIVIQPGFCVSDDGTALMVLSSNRTIDLDASGLNGLDTGSKTNETKYDVYLINKENGTVGGVFVLENDDPVMPTDFINKRWIGNCITDDVGDIIDFHVLGPSREIYYIYRQSRLNPPLEVKSGGSATVWTTIFLEDIVPSRVSWIKVHVRQFNSSSTYFREFLNGEGIDQPFGSIGINGYSRDNVELGCDSDMKMQYLNGSSGGNTEVQIVGYKVVR